MPLKWASFFQYRNLTSQELDTSASQVFFVGENGQGKTNLLEAIYLLHVGSSFRTRTDQQLSRLGTNEWSVQGEIETDGETKRILTKFQGGKKTISIDEKPVTDRRELVTLETIVLFSHDDFLLITESHEQRRRFFDQTFIQISDGYLTSWKRYQNLLGQRNALLKQKSDESLLDVIEQQMDIAAKTLLEYRMQWLDTFGSIFTETFDSISNEKTGIHLEYRPSIPDGNFQRIWKNYRLFDQEKGHTQYGPHRDRWYVRWKNQDFKISASTGQVRLASLSFKVAQALFLKERVSRPMVFLLDDVLLELDREKRRRLMAYLPGYNQVFYTFLPGDECFVLGEERLVYKIKEGTWIKTTI